MEEGMSTYEPDQRVVEFRDRLTGRARRNLADTALVTHADLIKALNNGHTPKAIADACNRDLPSSDRSAYRLLQTRIAWFATHPLGTQQPAPQPPRHDCRQHPDGHVCPWVDRPDGRVERCPCPPMENTA